MTPVFLTADLGEKVVKNIATVWGSANASDYLERVAAHFRQIISGEAEVGEGDCMVLTDLLGRFDYMKPIQIESLEAVTIETILKNFRPNDKVYSRCTRFLTDYFSFAYNAKRICGPADEMLVSYCSKLKEDYPKVFEAVYLFVITAFEPQLKSLVKKYTADYELYEDFMQTARLCIFEKLPLYDSAKSGLSTYLRLYVSHAFMDALPTGAATHYQAWIQNLTVRAMDELDRIGITITSKSIADHINTNYHPYKEITPGQIEKVLTSLYTSSSLDAIGGDAPSDIDDPLAQIIHREESAPAKITKFRKTLDPVLRDILDMELSAYEHTKVKPKTGEIKAAIHLKYPGCSEDHVGTLMRTLDRLLIEFILKEDGKTCVSDSYVVKISVDHEKAAEAEMDDLTDLFLETADADDDVCFPDI